MHVGLNLLFLVPGETGGTEVAARHLLPALVAAAPDVRFTAFVNREAAGEDFGMEQVVVPVSSASRAQWVLGEQLLLPGLARHVDVLHSPANTAPAAGPFARVTTIHDLLSRIVPDAHFGLRGLGMRALIPLAARRSTLIITGARSAADDLTTMLHVPPAKLTVVPHGVAAPTVVPTPAADLRARLSLGDRPVVLSLSAKRPHKNLSGLIDAFAQLDDRPVLVLAGYPTPHEAELRDRVNALGLETDVRFAGWLPAADVEGLFAVSRLFCFPSFYEGFGLPVLEAMVRGVPVACADRSSLPEVAGDAALLFDPDDPAQIAGALRRLLHDDALATRLAAAGRARAAAYTWDRTARETLEVYRRATAA